MKQSAYVPYGLLALAVVAASLLVPHFATGRNLGNVLLQVVPLLLVTSGQMVVLITAGIDISIGATVTLTAIVASSAMAPSPAGIVLGVVAALAAGAAVGLLNGLGIARLRLQPFLMTLATMFALQGLNLYLRPVPGGLVPNAFRAVANVRVGILPIATIVVLAGVALLAVYIRNARFGLELYAVGGDPHRAHLAGAGVTRTLVRAYVVSGVFAALAGLFLAARTGTGDSTLGDAYAFDSITAAILGGASLFGGRGTLWGAVAGALFLAIVGNALNLLGVTAAWQWIVSGGLLVAFVAASAYWEGGRLGKHRAVPEDPPAPA